MTVQHAGLAAVRVREHPRSAEIDPTARLVMVMMATFVGTGPRDRADPSCFASVATIAEATRFGESAVVRAQKRLAALGLIERVGRTGRGLGHTVRYRLLLVRDDARTGSDPREQPVRGTEEKQPVRGTEERPVRGTEERPVRGNDNPSDPVATPRERKGEEDRTSAVAPASAGAPAVAAGSSTENTLVDEVAQTLGCSSGHAERYIERKINDASKSVMNRTAYIRRCLDGERTTTTSPSKPTGRDRSRPGKGAGKGPGSGRGRRTTSDERAKAVAALQNGRESVADVTARLGVAANTVKAWWADADRTAAFRAVRSGEDVADVLARYPRCPRNAEPTLRHFAHQRRAS